MKTKTTYKTPKLILVGAGPGDPELISLKGINAIKNADVILYDALVSKELLKYAPRQTKIIYVGKRANNHTYKQDEINKLIVENALNSGTVIRLKGGDPYIFGRGFEEQEYAEALGVKVELIPGISSALSIPALQGIPTTKRGLSNGFWTITATLKNGKTNPDIELASLTNSTLVVLMGTKKLPEIVKSYTKNGKSNTSIAIIQNGSLPNEKLVVGKINNILDLAKTANIGAPAIIIIGDVVKEHKSLNYELLDNNVLNSSTLLN